MEHISKAMGKMDLVKEVLKRNGVRSLKELAEKLRKEGKIK